MITKVFDFFLIIGAIQGFIFALIPLFLKRKIETPIWLLNGLVLSISLNNLQAWLIAKKITFPLPFISELQIPWYMLATPLFFAFTIHFLGIKNKVKDLITVFIGVFMFEVLFRLIIIFYFQEESTQKLVAYNNYEEIFNIIIAIYLFSKTAVVVFKKQVLYESITLYDDIVWIKQFISLGFFIIIFWVLAVFANNYLPVQTDHITYYYPLRLASSILIYWIGYQGLIRFNLLQDRISLRKVLQKNEAINYHQTSDIITEKQKETFLDIEKYLLKHKRYLDPSLSLSLLAKEQNISISYLSKLINTYGKTSFSDYINKLRVDRAKILLSDKQYNKYTIVSIGLECGFNSKSTFYNAFKRFTDLTPSAYREQFLKD